MHRDIKVAATATLVTLLAVSACTGSGGSSSDSTASTASTEPPADTGVPEPALPTAPDSQRVDLDEPVFSDPTNVDNPLFPVSAQHSVLLLGNEDGHPLRIEVTLLPDPKVIECNGEQIETLVSQFVSYEDGRIHEVALDWYAQADDGAVWYFGEDVFNYEDGVVADTDGTWLACKDGPPGMIMPADPQIGDAYRPENIPDFVFEEVVVSSVGLTVPGPNGPVEGAIVGQENHLIEGHFEDKTFAPGYGEFTSGVGGNLEALALAVPTDARPGPVPAELLELSADALDIFAAADREDWDSAALSLGALETAWAAHLVSGAVPPLLQINMARALEALAGDATTPAVDDRNVAGAQRAAIRVAQASLDIQLQYRPVAEIDLARFDLWTRQLVVDSGGPRPEPGQVAGDVTVLEWLWDRIAHTADATALSDIEAQLADLRAAADAEDPTAAAETATSLLDTLAQL